jgi:hypothetical protein
VLARVLLMWVRMSQQKDPNQGEGDRASARRYDDHVRDFVQDGKVEGAAREAESYVEHDPEGAAKAEAAAKHGPHSSSVDQLVAKGRSFVERLRARFARK